MDRLEGGAPPDIAIFPQPGLLNALADSEYVLPLPGSISAAARASYRSGIDDLVGTDLSVATRLAGRIGWLWFPNRASALRASMTAAVESGEYFIGLSFEATYGLLDVGFVGPKTYGSLASGSAAE